MTLTFAEPTQLWLELTANIQASAWQSAQAVAIAGSRWQIYINQLCLRAFLAWLEEEEEEEKTLSLQSTFPTKNAPASCWELVTGTSVEIGDTKLVLIPTDSLGHDDLQVPQEWVDLPNWAADYYIAVKVNPEEGWAELWGYTTHQQLKEQGHYDVSERTVGLNEEELSQNLNVLWTTMEYCAGLQTQAAVQPVAELSSQQADNLVQRLAKTSVAFPRLSVPFSQWGALLNDDLWRSQLYQQRLTALQSSPSQDSTLQANTGLFSQVNHLSEWLRELQTSVEGAIASQIESQIASQQWQRAQLALRQDSQPGEDTTTQAKIIQINTEERELLLKLIVSCQRREDHRLTINAELHPHQAASC